MFIKEIHKNYDLNFISESSDGNCNFFLRYILLECDGKPVGKHSKQTTKHSGKQAAGRPTLTLTVTDIDTHT